MPSAIAVDPLPLLKSTLLTAPAVSGIVGDRIYNETLPANPATDGTIQNFYQPAVVLASSGGLMDTYVEVFSLPRLQVRCYAPSRLQARQLWFIVNGLLHHKRYIGQGVSVVLELNAGPNMLPEPGNGTPRYDGFYALQVLPV